MAYRQGIFIHEVERIEIGKLTTPNKYPTQTLVITASGGDEFRIVLRLKDASVAVQSFEHIEVTA